MSTHRPEPSNGCPMEIFESRWCTGYSVGDPKRMVQTHFPGVPGTVDAKWIFTVTRLSLINQTSLFGGLCCNVGMWLALNAMFLVLTFWTTSFFVAWRLGVDRACLLRLWKVKRSQSVMEWPESPLQEHVKTEEYTRSRSFYYASEHLRTYICIWYV